MCLTYRIQMKCGHTDSIAAPCEFRDDGVKDWRGKSHACPKKIVCRSDQFRECIGCSQTTSSRKTSSFLDADIPQISWRFNKNVSQIDLSISQVLVRNEGFLRRRQELRPQSTFVPPSTSFDAPNPGALELQILVNEEFLRRRESKRVLAAHMASSRDGMKHKAEYQFYLERAELLREAKLLLQHFQKNTGQSLQPATLKVASRGSQTERMRAKDIESQTIQNEGSSSSSTACTQTTEDTRGLRIEIAEAEFLQYKSSLDNDTERVSGVNHMECNREADTVLELPESSNNDDSSGDFDTSPYERPRSRLENRSPFDDFYAEFEQVQLSPVEEKEEIETPPPRLENRPFHISFDSMNFGSPLQRQPSRRRKISLHSVAGSHALNRIREYLSLPANTSASQIFEWASENQTVFEMMREGKQQLHGSRCFGRKLDDIGMPILTNFGWNSNQEFLEAWQSIDWDNLPNDPAETILPLNTSDQAPSTSSTPTEVVQGSQIQISASTTLLPGSTSSIHSFLPSHERTENQKSNDVGVTTDASDTLTVLERRFAPRATEIQLDYSPTRSRHGPSSLRKVMSLVNADQISAKDIPLPLSPEPLTLVSAVDWNGGITGENISPVSSLSSEKNRWTVAIGHLKLEEQLQDGGPNETEEIPLPISLSPLADNFYEESISLLNTIKNLLNLPRYFTATDIRTWIDENGSLLQNVRDGRVLLPLAPREGGFRDEARIELLHAIASFNWEEIDGKMNFF